MVKQQNYVALGLALSLCLYIPARGTSQDNIPPTVLPAPMLLEAHPPTDGHSWAPVDEGDTHGKFHRLWKFITFRQPPRPRVCHECMHGPSSRCWAPLYEYFNNRYPDPHYYPEPVPDRP